MTVGDFIKGYEVNNVAVVLHNGILELTVITNIETLKENTNLWFLRDADVKSWNIDGADRIHIEYV